jgi:hypothetical protein
MQAADRRAQSLDYLREATALAIQTGSGARVPAHRKQPNAVGGEATKCAPRTRAAPNQRGAAGVNGRPVFRGGGGGGGGW